MEEIITKQTAKGLKQINKGIREDRHMDTAKAEMLFNYFASNGIKNLKIMGGEPTVHPDFLGLRIQCID